jgi:hypothetical protein
MIVRFAFVFIWRFCWFIMVMMVMLVVDTAVPMTVRVRMLSFLMGVRMNTGRHKMARTARASD